MGIWNDAKMNSLAAYFLNNWALTRTDSSRVALFIYLQFVLAAPLSWILLGERPTWRLLPAALLVLGGLGLAVRATPHSRAAPAAGTRG